LVVAV